MAEQPKSIASPTKTLSWEEFYSKAKSDNANKLMNRVWYCIACSAEDVAQQKVFWEHWYWKNEVESENKNHVKIFKTQNSSLHANNY